MANEITAWPGLFVPGRAGSRESAPLSEALAALKPISLQEMDSVSLLERRDTKYVLTVPQFETLLGAVPETYRVLEIDGLRLHPYQTVYFDTADLALFRAHHNAKPLRYKVRSRLYVETGTAYLEVKAKDRRDRTLKSRTATDGMVTALSNCDAVFVESHAPYPTGQLEPRLLNTFSRITLVSLERVERVTVDVGLAYAANGEVASLPGLVVVEVKQLRGWRNSPLVAALREFNAHPVSFSKYCVGVSLLYPGIKHNRFKRNLLLAERITGGEPLVG